MTCVICKQGRTRPGLTTVTLQRGQCTVILKGVPADICENCAEYYLSQEVAARVLEKADAAAMAGTELSIRQYAA
jgi:YgiT-type zinc finger domain-containing protein